MIEFAQDALQLLGSAGGGLALALIVALAAAIVLLTALFASAAVVVLVRFARLSRRLPTIAVAALVWSCLVALVTLDIVTEGLFQDAVGVRALWQRVGVVTALAVALAVLGTRFFLKKISDTALGLSSLGFLVAGGAGLGAARGEVGLLWAGAGVFALAAVLVYWRTRLRIAAAALVASALVLGVAPAISYAGFAARDGAGLVGMSALAAVLGLVVLGLVPLAVAGLLDTRGSAEWFIAVRYLVAKRRQTFISVITAICIAGVAAGVWLIITVLSVMNGFERTWREEIIGNRAHFTVMSTGGPFAGYRQALVNLEGSRGIVAASPYLDAEGMVRGDNGGVAGLRIHGVDPTRISAVTDLDSDLLVGSLEALEEQEEGQDPGILIGTGLASALGLNLESKLVLISPVGGPPTPFGSAPRLVPFRVVGIFETSFFQLDDVLAYVNLEAAQRFRQITDVVDGIEVRTDDYYRSAKIAGEARDRLGDSYYTVDWKEYFPAFFQALKTERVMMLVLLTMIMVVAAFAIVVTLVMMIMEKSGDIAILKTMGAEDSTVERIFAIEGVLIGLSGTVLGLLAGLAVTSRLGWIQRKVEEVVGVDALPASVYQGISELPAELNVTQIALVVAIAMVLSLGGTWIPSRQAARLEPAEALRYE